MALTFERLQYLLEDFNPSSYSGRGMYGRQCLSITTDRDSFSILAKIMRDCEDVEEASALLAKAKTDSMGRGTVIYWPSIEIPQGVTIGDDDNDDEEDDE